MPRLPDRDALGARPTPRPSSAVVGYDGGIAARALVGVGQAVGAVSEEYEKEQDVQAVMAARRQLDDWEREAIFDPEKGAVGRQGKDAFDLPKTVPQSFDEVAGKVAAGLTSKRQKLAFQELAASRRSQLGDWANRHALTQRNAYEEGQYQADLKAFADRASLFPDKAAVETEMMRQRTIGYLRSKGRSEEEIQGALRDQGSVIHGRVIASMLNAGNGEEAKKYLDANKAGMTSDAVLRSEAALKEVVARGRAQAFGDEIMVNGVGLNDALAEARKRFTGIEEDAALQEIKTRFSEAEVVKARDAKATSDEAWKILANGGSRKSIPAELWNRLPGEEQRQVNDWVEAKWRRAKADAEGTGNDETPDRVRTFIGLMDMAANEPSKFAELDLVRYAPMLTKTHRDQLIRIRAGIDKNDAKAQDVAKLTQTTMKMLDQSLLSAGVPMAGKRSEKQIVAADMFKARLIDELGAAAAAGKLDAESARKIGLGLLQQGIEQGSGGWFSGPTKKRAFEFEPGKTYISKTFDDIPADVRGALVIEQRERSKRGTRELTDEDKRAIEVAYRRGQERGAFK